MSFCFLERPHKLSSPLGCILCISTKICILNYADIIVIQAHTFVSSVFTDITICLGRINSYLLTSVWWGALCKNHIAGTAVLNYRSAIHNRHQDKRHPESEKLDPCVDVLCLKITLCPLAPHCFALGLRLPRLRIVRARSKSQQLHEALPIFGHPPTNFYNSFRFYHVI